MKVLALTRYGTAAASTRQRFTQFFPYLAEHGIQVELAPLLGDDWVRSIGEQRGRHGLVRAYAGRLARLLTARRYDVLWVSSELFPFLPGLAERLIQLTGRPYVVDYDDAIFEAYQTHPRQIVRAVLGRKLEPLLRSAAAVLCGNQYIQDYVKRFSSRSLVLPTVVDTDVYKPAATRDREVGVIGWIGSPTTWANVVPLLPTLLDRASAWGATVRVVGAGSQADGIDGVTNIAWREDREVADIQAMSVGIMPLIDGPFQRGKCGYKLIQYMACGLPVVGAPVGVNTDIIQDGRTGFLATSDDEWAQALDRLLGDAALRARFGAAGRDRAVARYSLQAHRDVVLDCFQRIERKR